jgi:ribosomal protein S18 acetylase RimI-like enzyme
VRVRRATEADLGVIAELWDVYRAELDDPFPETWEEARPDLERLLHEGLGLLAEDESGTVGFAFASVRSHAGGFVHVVDLYVDRQARRQGLAKQLLSEVIAWGRERGLAYVSLDVSLQNSIARAVYDRLGFRPISQSMVAPLEALGRRVAPARTAPSTGRVYVQTDDEGAVERAVRQFVPRLGRSERTEVFPPYNGWTAVDDELCSREPRLLRRLARELSDRTGAVVLSLGIEEGAVVRYVLFERGSVADEYASLPEYHGPLPPGDVVALNANPTVVARLTGADPARVREVARTASSAAELPAPEELYATLVEVLGVGASPRN